MIRILLRLLLLTILSSGIAHAGINEGMVEWLAQEATFTGVRQVEFHPVVIHTDYKFDFDAAAAATQTLRNQLTKAGLVLNSPGSAKLQPVVIKSSVEYYQPGSVGERWIGFGGGAAVCILRTQLFDGQTDHLLADFVATYQIQVGGLFTIGAEKVVPRSAAELIADRIIMLVGLKRVVDELEDDENDDY